jgi:hypothetical protein
VRWPRVHRYSEEYEAEVPSAKEGATCHHPATAIRDSGLPDLLSGCSVVAPKGVPV